MPTSALISFVFLLNKSLILNNIWAFVAHLIEIIYV